jgi:tripartite-type tricarboxylate transporter receptor subunit TctC
MHRTCGATCAALVLSMERKTMRLVRVLLSVLPLALAFTPALAQAPASSFPDKPLKLIVPFPPGGPIDTMARFLAAPLGARLGQPVVVENRPGTGGTLGTRAAAQAEPDGYTLFFATSGTLAVAPALYANIGYDPLASFVAIASTAVLPHLFAVRPDLPVRSVAEFVSYAKANPGKLNYGASLATPPYLLGTLFKQQAGIDVVYIPYKGSAPSVTDLLAGTTHWTIDGLTILGPHAREGKLRPLALASGQRWPDWPELPTLVESGFPDVSLDAWAGVMAPAGTPAAIVDRLNALINDSLAGPEVAPALARLSALPKLGTPASFARFIAADLPRWTAAVRLSGAKID